MPIFNKKSNKAKETCNFRLIHIADVLIRYFDCTVLWGFRNVGEQNQLFEEGKSLLRFPYSAHNKYPSRAIDLQPYPHPKGTEQEIREQFMFFRGMVYLVAMILGIRLKPTIKWDLYHYELDDSERDDI